MRYFPALKELRISRNLTQSQLAQALHLGQRTISSYENGEREPLATSLMLYADFFEVSIDYIVGREDDFGNITATPLPSEILSQDEKELLRLFKKLDRDFRHRALGFMKKLADASEDEQHIPSVQRKGGNGDNYA